MYFVHLLLGLLFTTGATSSLSPPSATPHDHASLSGKLFMTGDLPHFYFNTSEVAQVAPPELEVYPLVVSGRSDNRVDFVFFSDGYVASEKEKFLDDALRLAQDVTRNQTFDTVKPMLNFWAAFTPSAESGIGVGGVAKDTVYGLFRYGTELRGVYYEKPEVATAACASLGDQCDYPILLGNDPLYGGLGGEFTVITSSYYNGPLVLRHELGHSIIDVGEEYDGANTYFGTNHAASPDSISWSHWLTNPPNASEAPRVESSNMPFQAYTWTMLNTSSSWSTTFNSAGTYDWFLLRISLSGLPLATDLRVALDGVDLGWTPVSDIGMDRYIYDIIRAEGLKGGNHTLEVTLLNEARVGAAQLCSVEIMEYGNEADFVSTPGYYGIFKTFTDQNETFYRPTSEECLMRQVITPNFCSVCKEGLWLALLQHVNLIDGLLDSCSSGNTNSQSRTLEVQLVPFAQFRTDEQIPGEQYTITWFKDGVLIPGWTNKTTVQLGAKENGVADISGEYTVDVELETKEVRLDPDSRLKSSGKYSVSGGCTAGKV